MGISQPTQLRSVSNTSPSASGCPSATMAPWNAIIIASTGPFSCSAFCTLSRVNWYTSAVTGPEGVAPILMTGISSKSCSSSSRTERKPPISVPQPLWTRKSSSPTLIPGFLNAAISAGAGEKAFVSWKKRKTRIFLAICVPPSAYF